MKLLKKIWDAISNFFGKRKGGNDKPAADQTINVSDPEPNMPGAPLGQRKGLPSNLPAELK